VPVTLVLAEDDGVFVLSGSHGTESVVLHIQLSSAASTLQWRHVRVEASSSSLGSEDGVTVHRGLAKYETATANEGGVWWWHLIELCLGEESGVGTTAAPLKFWLAGEEARLVKAFLARWVTANV
jgi:hypothetical protein